MTVSCGDETSKAARWIISGIFSDNVNDLYDDRRVMVIVLVNKPQEINDYEKGEIQAFHT
jgi:hypothetical protein